MLQDNWLKFWPVETQSNQSLCSAFQKLSNYKSLEHALQLGLFAGIQRPYISPMCDIYPPSEYQYDVDRGCSMVDKPEQIWRLQSHGQDSYAPKRKSSTLFWRLSTGTSIIEVCKLRLWNMHLKEAWRTRLLISQGTQNFFETIVDQV